ncbi:MAG: protoglobin domain-containing protein [Aquificota bacterium]|jgi:uncharacterized membrane protein (DUF373 family)
MTVTATFEYEIERLLRLHQLGRRDAERIKFLANYLKPYKEEFLRLIEEVIQKFTDLRQELDESDIQLVKKEFSQWYDRLFEGNYDAAYLNYLLSMGEKFFQLGFSPHHIIVLIDYARNFFNSKIFEVIREQKDEETIEKLRSALKSLNKVLDLNLDVLISYYVDSETKLLLYLGRWGRFILGIAKKVGLMLDSAILAGLIILAAFIIYLFITDILHIAQGGIAHGIIAALGDLLILWTILELLNSEIKFMLGGEFAVSSFVSVALAATIREALITSLQHNKPIEFKISLAVIILVLGFVYGIVKWFEVKSSKKRS